MRERERERERERRRGRIVAAATDARHCSNGRVDASSHAHPLISPSFLQKNSLSLFTHRDRCSATTTPGRKSRRGGGGTVFSLSPSLSRSLSLSVTDQELNNGDGARLLARFSTPSLTFFFLSLLLLFLSSTAPARQRPPRPLRPSRRAQKVKRGKTENENAVSQLSVSLLIFTLSFPLFFFSLFLSRLSTTTRTHAAPALSPAAIAALYQNCLKLASENKITA